MMKRLLYPWPYLALDIYMQLKDLLLELELKMLFFLPIPLKVWIWICNLSCRFCLQACFPQSHGSKTHFQLCYCEIPSPK